MRSAENFLRCCIVAAAGAAATGCASLAVAPDGAVAIEAPVQAKPAEAAVAPEVQRAFDDARRALKAGRMAEAERGFRALVRTNPELGGPHANLGVIARQAGKLPEAAAELEQAVRLSPQQPLYFDELGVTYRLNGQFEKARDAYEKAIAVDPNYAVAQLNLGILYDLYLWDSARALEHYDRYLALTPGGDDKVKKWIADINNRSRQKSKSTATAQEKK